MLYNNPTDKMTTTQTDLDDVKCAWCNSRGVDRQNAFGVWVHEECESEDDAWEDVYLHMPFYTMCGEHPHLQDYKYADYYQTFGGGPEGGYITLDGAVYKVERGWGTPFGEPEKVEGVMLEVRRIDYGHGDYTEQCRVVKTDNGDDTPKTITALETYQ